MRIQKHLKQRGAYSYHPHGAGAAVAGVPDLLVCYKGRFLGLEVKLPGGDATELQAHTIRMIQRACGLAGVVHSVEEAEGFLRMVDSESARG